MKQWIWKLSWDSLPVFFACPKFTTNSYPHWATPDVPYGDTHILVLQNRLPFWSFDIRFACHWGNIYFFHYCRLLSTKSKQKSKTIVKLIISHIQTHTHTCTTIDSIDCFNFDHIMLVYLQDCTLSSPAEANKRLDGVQLRHRIPAPQGNSVTCRRE